MLKLLFPTITGKWQRDIKINKYAMPLLEDTEQNPFLNPDLFDRWIRLIHASLGVDYSWGGWMENREDILRGTYLPDGGRIHLGIDFWVPYNVGVYLPKTGNLVYSRRDEDQNGGWGGQAIFEIDGIYWIFGHLKTQVTVEREYKVGEFIGFVAESSRNGGWPPHLHLQCMRTLDTEVDGYSRRDPLMFEKFPDPMSLFKGD